MFIFMAAILFESWEEIAGLVSEFETGALPHARWKTSRASDCHLLVRLAV
jgi:hypothetical protein